MAFGIQGLRVLVTASTRGIGHGVAEVLLEEGARVVINGRNRERIEEALEGLRGRGEVYGVAADLTRRDDVKRLVNNAAKLLGGLDAVVYVTGPPRPGVFEELGLEDWDYAARLLVMSAVWVAYYALPYLRESSRPSLVYVTSVATKEPVEGLTLSNALRIAVHGLVKTLSRELGRHGIRVNAVMPGYIMTDRVRQLAERRARREGRSPEEVLRDIAASVPLGRIGEPREVGYLVAFLLSPYAGYINGASIPVDGGLLHSVF
ncbi:short-chain dehydrogenase [Pyrodictium occultum]|uniref:Short-chain dehydrogenase n=1 Tax=Pyrodictium occultum TaxID=2309 RepID=A0A0V8RUS4_PYROC|nr:SDR family oxidoreductase [Pyrodictium occultum]KSW11706.1 short-chain dehydrogenase [Pyrodictium occultum]